MNFFTFIYNKLKHLPIHDILLLEVESWVYSLVDVFPGLFGIILRAPIYKLFFKDLNGIPIIQRNVTIVHSRNLSVGKHFGVNKGTYINAVGGIKIGDFVLVGSNVTISSGRHNYLKVSPPIFARPSEPIPINIEDDVWIGSNAVIMPGITLRKGTVVGAGAVVTSSTEPYSIVVGIPARKIKSRI